MYVQVSVLTCYEPLHDVAQELSVFLDAFIHAHELAVLLDAPNGPQ